MSTANSPQKEGWDETVQIWKENAYLWVVPGLILGIAIGFVIGIFASGHVEGGFLEDIWPELLSTGVAVALLYYLDKWRDDVREQKRLKKDLLWQIRSRVGDIAIGAIDRMRHEEWLIKENSLLKGINLKDIKVKWAGANLTEANLQSASLESADLRRSYLLRVNLEYASLEDADLTDAFMKQVILRGANLTGTGLSGTNLSFSDMRYALFLVANLQNANLLCADLRNATLAGTDLSGALLLGANLEGVFWHNPGSPYAPTIMPDGEPYHSGTDISRFTDALHDNPYIPPKVRGMFPGIPEQRLEGFILSTSQKEGNQPSLRHDAWLPRQQTKP